MRVKDLRIIIAICRTGSFSKAAEALRITQPAVSQAVKRVETDLQIRIFERASSPISLSNEGAAAAKSIEKVIELLDGIRANGRDGARTRLGVTPLLSGRDVARLLNRSFEAHRHSFDVEFLDSSILSSRADFDAKIVMPSLRRRSSLYIDLMTVWIGVRNGVFIYSRQEADVWEQARLVLQASSIPVERVIEVNDCGYAYHMAASGAGFSPCVLTAENGFREHQIADMPALPNVRLDIFASHDFGRELKANLLGS